jgi:hypothetical protein
MGTLTPTVVPEVTSPPASPAPNPTPTPVVGPIGQPTPTAFNPCVLLTSAQASAINKVTYGAGVPSRASSGMVECVWQSNAPHASVTVQVALLSNPGEAEAAFAEAVGNEHFTVTNVPNFGDKAAVVRAPHIVNTGGIYVRDGSLFFDVVYLNGSAPTDGELKLAAEIVLGGLPSI